MFKVNSPIHDFIELVLAGTAHFAPDYIKKSLGFPKTTLTEDLEFFLHYQQLDIIINLPLILLLVVQGSIF